MATGKYQITELKKCTADYRNILGDERKDELHDRIIEIIVDDKKYRDKDYTASRLAADLGTNCRYISAFYASFYRFLNTTPREFRVKHLGPKKRKRYSKKA